MDPVALDFQLFPTQVGYKQITVTNRIGRELAVTLEAQAVEPPSTCSLLLLTSREAQPQRLVEFVLSAQGCRKFDLQAKADKSKCALTRFSWLQVRVENSQLTLPVCVKVAVLQQVIAPFFVSPSTHYVPEHGRHVFSIIKDGNKEQTFTLRVTNKSAIEASVKIALPFNGKNDSFLIYSVLPVRQFIKAFETKSFTIKVKVDLKKAGMDDMHEINTLLGLDIERGPDSNLNATKQAPKRGQGDQEIKTLLSLQIADSEIQVVIPFRIHYKRASRLSKSCSLYG